MITAPTGDRTGLRCAVSVPIASRRAAEPERRPRGGREGVGWRRSADTRDGLAADRPRRCSTWRWRCSWSRSSIGIVNGLDLYEFNHDQLLTHVHSGTLGWVTLTLVAAVALGVPERRPPAGAARSRSSSRSTSSRSTSAILPAPGGRRGGAPRGDRLARRLGVAGVRRRTGRCRRLAVALGLTTFAYGAIIGVLLQVQMASGPTLVPGRRRRRSAPTPATMVFSYLDPRRDGPASSGGSAGRPGRPRAGLVQLGALFAGGADPRRRPSCSCPTRSRRSAGSTCWSSSSRSSCSRSGSCRRPVRVDWIAASPGATPRDVGDLRRRRDGHLHVPRRLGSSGQPDTPTSRRSCGDPRRERPRGVHRRDHEPRLRARARARGRPRGRTGRGPTRSSTG